MAETRISARARVQVTLSVEVPDTWGTECSVAQIHKQAARAALQRLSDMLDQASIRLEGTPRVVVIIVEEPHG